MENSTKKTVDINKQIEIIKKYDKLNEQKSIERKINSLKFCEECGEKSENIRECSGCERRLCEKECRLVSVFGDSRVWCRECHRWKYE